MALDLSSLAEALQSLTKTVRVACAHDKMDALEKDQQDAIKAGVIQNFEFTYELCWKFITRWLRENNPTLESELPRTRKDLFRAAAQAGLIEDPLPWFGYGDARNIIAHTYNRDKASEVFQIAVAFVADARHLLAQLEKYNV